MKYIKTPKILDEQIALIKSRGLIIDDEARLKKYLTNISYYHLSAYFKSFQNTDDTFKDGSTFEHVINLYEFDKKLRLLLLDVLERIEKSFKCSVIYNLSVTHNDSHWYLNSSLYNSQEDYLGFIEPLLNNIKTSKEVSIKHYYEKYSEPEYPPAWIALEVLTYGECVKLCRQLKTSEQNIFSRPFNIDKKFLLSWMHALSVVRNLCAHHSRLWNKNIILGLKMSHKNYEKFFNSDDLARARIYNYIVVIQIMMCKINPTSTWLNRLIELIETHKPYLISMGFPDDWRERLENINTQECVK